MKRVLEGAHAVSHAVELARVEVISAYPITPQTHIVELLAEMVARGDLDARFIRVESEHSAMAAVIASAAAGVRSFTASSSQGLALMHEMLHWASGSRLPLVMAEVNRALAPGWNIWCDQTDVLSQRDTGWMQLYCEDVQEVLDTLLVAYRLAEKVDLPAMVVLDAFFLSHTFEPVDVPDRSEVDAFLPPWRPEPLLDPANPRNVNQLCGAEYYEEFRMNLQKAMEGAVGAYVETDAEFGRRFGRSYGICEVVPAREGARAPMALLTTGSVTGTARATLPELAKKGFEADLVKLKLFRPFPAEELRRVLGPYGKVAVLDRNLSPGIGGIFAQEIRAALAPLPSRPEVHSFIAGLGGRDITPDTLAKIVERTLAGPPESESVWADAKVIP